MRPDESLVSQPIRSLQTMLRVLAEHDSRYHTVVPDGIYGPSTMRSVSSFQRQHGLPVTGITDQATWEAVAAKYEPALVFVTEAQPVEVILNTNEVLRRGDESPWLHLVQAMLYVLSQTYSSIGAPSRSGVLDDITADSLSSFQSLSGLPVTGNLDKLTWKHLALHFPLAANLSDRQPEPRQELFPIY